MAIDDNMMRGNPMDRFEKINPKDMFEKIGSASARLQEKKLGLPPNSLPNPVWTNEGQPMTLPDIEQRGLPRYGPDGEQVHNLMGGAPTVDYSKRPEFMSMEQFERSELRRQQSQGLNGTPLPNFDIVGNAMFGTAPSQMPTPPPMAGAMQGPMPVTPTPSMGSNDTLQYPQGFYDKVAGQGSQRNRAAGQQAGQMLNDMVPPSPITPQGTPIPSDLQTFPTPGGGTVGLPDVTYSVDDIGAGRIKTAEEIHKAATMYTPEEQKKVDRETMMGEAKARMAQRAAEKQLLKSLAQKGMKEDDIRSAIGADKNPDMTRGEAFKALQDLESKKKRETVSPRIARETERIAGRDDPDTDRWNSLEDVFSGTGSDPLGKPLADSMTPSQKKEYDRLRTKIADGRARENDIARFEKIAERLTKKSEKSALKRGAEEEQSKYQSTLGIAQQKAQTDDEKAWVAAQSKEYGILDDEINEYMKADNSDRDKLMTPEQFRDRLDRRGEIRYGFESFNRGEAPAPAQGGEQTPQQAQSFDSIADAEAANLPAGTPVVIGGRQAIIR